MKNLMFLFLLSGLFLFSCEKEDIKLFCTEVNEIRDAISIDDKTIDKAAVEAAINKITSDLAPNPSQVDPIGQMGNLIQLIERLNDCDGMEATFGCYACAESLPPLSSIIIVVEKGGQKLSKGISIITPDTGTLKYGGIY